MSELEAALENAHIGWDAERALADDLADVLNTVVRDPYGRMIDTPALREVKRALARYRKARQQ